LPPGALADAKQVKNLPSLPKQDPSDSRWLGRLLRARRHTRILTQWYHPAYAQLELTCPGAQPVALGGARALAASAAFDEVTELPASQVFLRATPTLAEYWGTALRRVFEVLAPVLLTRHPDPVSWATEHGRLVYQTSTRPTTSERGCAARDVGKPIRGGVGARPHHHRRGTLVSYAAGPEPFTLTPEVQRRIDRLLLALHLLYVSAHVIDQGCCSRN
jgi:hypothetical protein